MKTKSLFYSFTSVVTMFGIAFATVSIQSCSTAKTSVDSSAKLLGLPAEYVKMDKQQNAGYEAALKSLEERKASSVGETSRISAEECLKVMEKAMDGYYLKNGIDSTSSSSSKLLLKPSLTSVNAKRDSALSQRPELMAFMNNVFAEIRKTKTSEHFESFLKEKAEVASKTLSAEDAKIAFATIGTMLYSYRYWKENHGKWEKALKNK